MNVTSLDDRKRALLHQFREAVADCRRADTSDDYLFKWLVARDFDLHKAEKMFRQSMEWRIVHGIDELVDKWNPPEVLQKYYSIGNPGYDKFGCAVWISALGRTDMKGILQSISKRDYIRFIVYITEKSNRLAHHRNLLTGSQVTQTTLIVDFEHLALQQMTYKPFMDVGMSLTSLTEANYPEGVRRVFLINVPSIFSVAFSMVKPFLSKATLTKISVFGSDKGEWSKALLEQIDANELPAHYGGCLTDPDGNPMCLTLMNMGGEVPQKFYLTNRRPTPRNNMVAITISPGAKETIKFLIKNENSILRWSFMTEGGDISFRIFYIKEKEEIDVIESDRVNSHCMIEESFINCIHRRTYVMEFDNSFSLLRSKKLWHHIILEDHVEKVES